MSQARQRHLALSACFESAGGANSPNESISNVWKELISAPRPAKTNPVSRSLGSTFRLTPDSLLTGKFAKKGNLNMKISVFVDGANFFYMQRDGLHWFADPKKIIDYIQKSGQIIDAFYYIGQDAPPDARQQSFLDALPEMGYTVITKTIKTIYDSKTGTTKRKANLDIEIVLDMFNTIDHYDKAILISGDGDFERPLQLLRARGKHFEVIATDSFIARELRAVAGRHYTRFEDIKVEVEKI